MPIPKRRKDEDRTDFLSRCMGDSTMNKDYPDNKQRYAICIGSSKADISDQIKDNYYDQTFGSTEEITEDNLYIPEETDYVDFGEQTEEYTIALQYGKPGPNDPRKTPAPKKDQKKGSKRNRPDSAKDDKGSIKFSKETVAKLSNLVTEHNSKDKGSKVTLGMLKAVYRRGAGAFSTSHHPNMSRDGWAMARVRAFLYLARNGRPSNPNYKQDNDLLPKAHPRSTKANDDNYMQVSQLNKMHQQLMALVKLLESVPFEFEEWTKDKISKAEHYIEAIYDSVFYTSKTDEYSEDEDEEDMDEVEEPSELENPETDMMPAIMAVEYQGKKVTLNKPFRTPKGPKKFSVYVKNDKGNVVKVNFGDPNMDIKRDDPERRKSFRARHQCDTNPGPKWKARYWSCRFWEAGSPVNKLTSAQKTFKGKKRSELKDSDFLFPETRSFPIATPQDVPDAISNFGRMKGKMSYDDFLKKLYTFVKRKGPEFVAALPEATKKKLGVKTA
jgi:hypothetical protein